MKGPEKNKKKKNCRKQISIETEMSRGAAGNIEIDATTEGEDENKVFHKKKRK